MIKIGIEKGDTRNEYVHSYDEASDRMKLVASAGEGIVRHIVTFDSLLEAKRVLPVLVNAVSGRLTGSPAFVSGWNEAGTSNTLRRRAEVEHRKQGYVLKSSKRHRIALRPLNGEQNEGCFDSLLNGRGYVVWGRKDAFDQVTPEIWEGLIVSAARSYAAPDENACSKVLEVISAIGYAVVPDGLRPGLVIVTRDFALSIERGDFGMEDVVTEDRVDHLWR